MAAFNLTAQLNLVGPTNIRQIVGDIRKQLGTIKGTINVGIDPQSAKAIAQAQSQAAQLSSGLNNVAKSGNTAAAGMRDLNDAAAKNQLGSTAKNAASAADAATNLGKQSSRAAKDVKVLGNELAEFGRQSGLAIRRFAAFSLVSGVMYKLNSAINQALSQYIDFDRELVRVSQVTGKSVQELGSLVDEISSLAGSTGVASKELIQVSSTLAQAGLSAREAEQALKALALSANAPSFDNLNDTVEGSIALMRQFGIRANELESALGSINAVAAAFAVEASDLITAISRTGGVFASASRGVSEGTQALNEFIAVFTSVRATTRESAETIATGLRTIFTRIQRESTITALRELGVELRDVEGKFVGPYEAVRRLSEGLGQLDPRSQVFANIIEELGGFRQIGKVIPLIQQFATAEAALQVALKGGDSLAEANRQAQQSLAVQLAKTREEFVALVRDFANNSVFRGFLTTTISITKSILSLARAGKSLFPLLTILGGFKAFSAATQFAGGFLKGVRPTGGRPGGSASRGIGQNLGEVISGSKSERQSASLDKIAKVLESNAGNFNTSVSSLIQPITQLSTAIQQNIVSLTDNTGALTANTAAINNLTAALGMKGTTLAGGGKVLGFAKGGTVPGSGKGDKVPALLEPGEVVMSNRAVNKYGRGNLVNMNKRYFKGGIAQEKLQTLVEKSNSIKKYINDTINPDDEALTKIVPFRVDLDDNDFREMKQIMIDTERQRLRYLETYRDDPKANKQVQQRARSSKDPRTVVGFLGLKKPESHWGPGNAFQQHLIKRLNISPSDMPPNLGTPQEQFKDIIDEHYAVLDYQDGDAKFWKDLSYFDTQPGKIDILNKQFKNVVNNNQLKPKPTPNYELFTLPDTRVYYPEIGTKEQFMRDYAAFTTADYAKTHLPAGAYSIGGKIQKFAGGGEALQSKLSTIRTLLGEFYGNDEQLISKSISNSMIIDEARADKIIANLESSRSQLPLFRKLLSEKSSSVGVLNGFPIARYGAIGGIETMRFDELKDEETIREFIKRGKLATQASRGPVGKRIVYSDQKAARRRFAVGGTVEGIAAKEKKSIETVILEQLSSFGDASGVKKILGLGAGEREISSILNASNIRAGKNIEKAIKFINRALAKTGKQDAAREAKEAAMRKVAIAGLFPLDYNKDFSDWKLEDGREIYGYVRGFQSSFLPQIEAMQEANRATRQKFAEDIQDTAALGGLGNRNIQGPIQPLAIDFDETLALGTKMLKVNKEGKEEEDLPAYADRKKVMESLAQARPTSLAKRLASIEQKNPGYVRMYSRILTARPQSTADIIASTLNRFGLPYLEQDVTGVSQGLGTNIAKAKAANVAAAEKLIDDSEENIRATMAAGKSTFRYGEVPELKGPAEEKFGQSNIEGGLLEAALSQLLGYNINVDALERNRAIDFPQGLGRGAQLFGLPPNIETEVKRTLDGDSFSKAREEFSRYFTENPQAYAKGGAATFGSGSFKFPKRISNAYVREMEKLLEQEQMEKVFSTYPGNERMIVDEEAVKKGYESPFSRELFINSFKDKINRNTVFERMGQFARVIGLPPADLLSAIPTQLDFGVNYPATALFSKDPSGPGTRGLQGVDLTPYGYTEQDKQDLFGYTKLIEEKKKQILKTIKTPVTTYEDGSFGYDVALTEKLRAELDDLQKQQRSLIDKNNAAIKAAKESRLQSANQSGRGSVGIATNPFNTSQRQDYSILYHELTHQLFNSLRTKNAQSFEAYKAKVSSLFDGNNDDVADAFDTLVGNSGYNSADVAYGRSYKLNGLSSLMIGSAKKESFEKYVNSDPEYVPELRKTWAETNSTTKAKAFKPLNPRVNDVLLRGKISQDVIDKYEDNGKEEFLTTLVQKLPLLDENLSGILDSTLDELLGGAEISRQKFAIGGKVNLYHGSTTGIDDNQLKKFKEQGALSNIAQGYGQGAGFYVWTDKLTAIKHADMRIKAAKEGINSIMGGDTGGKGMILEFQESLDPSLWDLDYEISKGPVIKWIADNYETLKDKVAASEGIAGVTEVEKYDPKVAKETGLLYGGANIMTQTATGSKKYIDADSAGDIREGEILGQIMNRLQSNDPSLVHSFENSFFGQQSFPKGSALKYVGSSPLIPVNIETFASGGKAGLADVNKVGEQLSSDFKLMKGKNAWNQLENNCLSIANKVSDMFGYVVEPDKIRQQLDTFQKLRLGKTSAFGLKPTEEVLKKMPSLNRMLNNPTLAASTGNIVVREGEEMMKHVSFEHMNKEYNFGAAGPDWPIVLRIPLKKKDAEQKRYGGMLNKFTSGGTIPALVSNGEAYVPPKLAKRIGYGTLSRMNMADKNGMGRFSDGGISVFKGPGSGTSDSIPTSLPVGSFIIREKATKALGLNKGGSVGIQKFQDGGAPTNSGDLYFTTLSSAQIQDIVGKGSSRTGIDVESLDLLTRYATDAGMSIEDFSSGLIRARDTAIESALAQGQSFKEAALAGQQAAIAMADIPNIQVTGENPLDVLRSLTASSTRVQANVEQRREILSDPEIIAAINETNDLMSKLTPAEQFSVQTGTGPMTPQMEEAAASRRRQKNIVGYKIEERQTQANQPGFVPPTIQQPTNLMDIDGINNQLKEAQNNAALYASSLRDQANAIRAQQEITIDPGTFAGLEAKAQALEEKAAATEKAYQDLADSTQESVSWFDTEYQAAIDSMRIRAESVAKATQDVEKAMVTRAKEIASANPELTAEEIGQQISTEKTGIVAEARAQQTEAETKFGRAQSRVDTLAGKAGAGADILAADNKAKAEAQAKADAEKALEARKQQARDLGAKRAAIAVPEKREYETEQEFNDRRQKATERFTRQSARELGLSKTRFVSSRQKKAIEEEEAKKTKVEREKTDVAIQSTDTKATLLLVQAINANTVAQTGSADSVKSLTEQTNGLIATNEQLTNAKNADIEQANASPERSDLSKDTLREIPFLDKLETLGSAVGDFANNFAASTTDIDGNIGKFGSVLQGGASRLESGIKKLADGIRNANTAFADTKIGKFADSFSQYGTAIGTGVTSVLQYMADQSNGYETLTGSILQAGSTIASTATIFGTFGAQFGPLGGLLGTLAGVGAGAVQSIRDYVEAQNKAAAELLETQRTDALEKASSDIAVFLDNVNPSAKDLESALSNLAQVVNIEKEQMSTNTEASRYKSTYGGLFVGKKTEAEIRKADAAAAAANTGGAQASKQLISGMANTGMKMEDIEKSLGADVFGNLKLQIAEADAIFVKEARDAADQLKAGKISGEQYVTAVDNAKNAAFERATSELRVKEANEEYRKSVTDVRKRLESQGTGFLKELITSTPKQRTEMKKDFASAGDLLKGDFTKSRAQQEEAAKKAFRETSGTVKEKREAAEAAKAQVRESNFQRAEQILSFGDQSSDEIRNARANLYETQLREQGINPNEGMAKMVIDSLRAPDPERAAQENLKKATEEAAKQLAIQTAATNANTDALKGGKITTKYATTGGVADAQTATNAVSNEGMGNLGWNAAKVIGAGAVTYGFDRATGGGIRRSVKKGIQNFRKDPNTPDTESAAEQPKPQKRKGFLERLLGGSEVADTPKPAVATDQTPRTPPRRQPNAPKDNVRQPPRRGQPSAEAPQPQAAVPGRKAKVSASAKKGVGGLVAAGVGLFAIGSSYFGGGAQPESDSGAQQLTEEDQPIIESSPEIIQLLSAIEANTRECCAGGGTGGTASGERVTTNTGSMENIPTTKEPAVAVEKKTDAIAKEITTAASEPITMMESLSDEFAAFSSRGYQNAEVTNASLNTLGSFATDIMGTTDVARTMRSGGIGDTTGQNKFLSKPMGVTGYTTRGMGAYGAVQSLRAFRETGAVDDALGIVAGAGNTAGGRYAGLVGDTASAGRNAYRLFSGKSREEATLAQDSLGLVADLGQVGLQASPEIAKYGPQALQTAKNFAPKSIPAPSVSTPVSTPSAAWLQANGYSSDEIAKIVGSGADDTAAAAGKSGGLLSKITKPLQGLGKIPGLGTAARLGGGVLGGLGVAMGGVSGYSADTEATGRNKYVNTALGALSGTGTTMGDVGQQSTIGGLLGVEKGSETDQMIGNASSLAAGTLGVAGAIGGAAALGVGAAAAAPALAIGATVAGGALLTQESIGLYNDRSVLAEKEKQTAAMEEASRRTKLVKNNQGEYVRQAKTAQDFDFGYNFTADESNAVRAYAKNQAESNRAKELASKTSLTQDETSELANIKKSFGMEEGASNQDILAEAQRRSDTAASDLAAKARTRATTTKVGLFGDRYDQLDEKKQTENMQKYLSAAQQYQPETFVQPEEIPAPQTTIVTKEPTAIQKEQKQTPIISAQAPQGTAAVQATSAALQQQQAVPAPETITGQGGQVIPVVGGPGSGAAITSGPGFIRAAEAYDAKQQKVITPTQATGAAAVQATSAALQQQEFNVEEEMKKTRGISVPGAPATEKLPQAQNAPTDESRSKQLNDVPTYGLSKTEQALVKSQDVLKKAKEKALSLGTPEGNMEANRLDEQIQSKSKELLASRQASAGGAGGDVMKDVNLYRQAREQAMAGGLPAATAQAAIQPSVVSAGTIDATMATQLQPAPAETDNWFKNAQADLTRIQASPDANITGNTQPANGVINTSTTQQQPTAAGMSQLFDTAAIGNTLQTVFGQFVSDLQNIQLPKIPDMVTMEGKHTVEVIINGADVLKSLEPMLQDIIKTKLTEFNNKLNSATEGGFGA